MLKNIPKILVLFVCLVIASCGIDPKKVIQKKWKMDAKVFIKKTEKKLNKKLSEEEKIAYKNFAEHLYIDFQPDGVVLTNLGGRLQKGKWTLNEEMNKVILSRREGKEVLKVIEISNNSLVLAHSDNSIKDDWFLIPLE